MNSLTKLITLSLLIIGLTACSNFMKDGDNVPGYKITVIQGNDLTPEQLNQLHVGMHKEDVKLLLGNPQLNNPFNDNSWYYVYTVLKAGKFSKKSDLVLNFADDTLTDISGQPKTQDYTNI